MAGWANVPAGKNKYDRLTRGGVTKYWSPGPLGLGGSYQTAATLNAQRQKEGKKPVDFTKIGVPKSTPASTPARPKMPGLPPNAAQPGTGPQGNKVGSKPPAPPVSPAPDREPPTPSRPTPAPTPFGRTMPAPAAASLDKYKINKDWAAANPRLAQAQVARASGQPRADINKILYKPGTAAYGAAGKSEMENQVDQMRQDREKMAKQREADKIGPKAQSALPGGAYSPAATDKMTPRTKNILGVKEQYDAYDLVLEYLFSQGHVDTVDEAHYVMMQMDGEYIQNIMEAEVLAMKRGVPGSVKVKPALSIPGTDIGIGPNKPVPGTFTTTTPGQREKIAKGDTTIDRGTYQQSRVGAGPTSAERQRYNAELIKQGKHTAPRMPQ